MSNIESLEHLLELIQSCDFLLQSQRDKVKDIIKRDYFNNKEVTSFEEIEKVMDELLWRLFNTRLNDLTTMERAELSRTIKELGYDNS